MMVEGEKAIRREAWIGESRVYLDEEDIFHIVGSGDTDDKTAVEIKQRADEFLELVEEKMRIIVDMNNSGKPSAEVRRVFNELGQNEKIGKVALHGIHPVARVIASFFMKTTTKREMRFFKTEEEALAWLEEGN